MNKGKLENRIDDKINDIPLPPTPSNFDFLNSSGKVKIKSNKKFYYITPTSVIIFTIIISLILYFSGANFLIFVLSMVVLIPLCMASVIFLFIRFYLDFGKAKSFVIKKVSKNFIIADFFQENKRLNSVVCVINNDGVTFNYKKGLYTIDKEAVWFDMDNYPHSFYLPNLPNPLLFDFQKDVKRFVNNILQTTPKVARDIKGELIDISYSSESLQMFKKDKIFLEFHRNPQAEKMLMIALGIVALSLIVIVLVVIFK